MLKNYLILLGLIVAIVSNAQTLEELELKALAQNKVKTKSQWDFKYIEGKPLDSDNESARTIYNTEGQEIERSSLNPKGETVNFEKNQYDERGNRIYYERSGTSGNYRKTSKYSSDNQILHEFGFNGSESFDNTYVYNSDGKLKEIVYKLDGDIDEKRVYSHKGNISTVGVYKLGEHLISKVRLVYNNNQSIIEETILSPDDAEIESKFYGYTPNNQIFTEEKKRDGQRIYLISYEYDDKGNLLNIYEESPTEKKYVKKSYKYDKEGSLIEYQWRRNESIEFNQKLYKYNDKGLCTEVETYYPKTDFRMGTRYEYEFY